MFVGDDQIFQVFLLLSVEGVLHLKEYPNLGAPRQLRKIPKKRTAGPLNSLDCLKVVSSFLTNFSKQDATKVGVPIAAPKISIPDWLFFFILLSAALKHVVDHNSQLSPLSSRPHLSTWV